MERLKVTAKHWDGFKVRVPGEQYDGEPTKYAVPIDTPDDQIVYPEDGVNLESIREMREKAAGVERKRVERSQETDDDEDKAKSRSTKKA